MGTVQQHPRQNGELVLDRGVSCHPPESREGVDDRETVGDPEARESIVNPQGHPPTGQVWVDVGCGRIKLPGFIGVDRFPLPGVDVVADLDRSLPFASDSVDLVYASHSLEHIADLSKVIREIYRICKHGAQICIIAPYYQQGLNLANPYHKQVFNEHTPRFWTSSVSTPIDPADYYHPHAGSWGLLESDNSPVDIDIRCVKMEFFYFPGYRDLPPELQRHHRQYGQDICDQMVYHLIVFKQPTPDDVSSLMDIGMELFESPYIEQRRLQERCERLEARLREAAELGQAKAQLEAEVREIAARNEELASLLEEGKERCEKLENHLEASECENRALHEWVRQLEVSREEIDHARADLERTVATVTSTEDWQLLQSLRASYHRLAPPNTLRRGLARIPLRLLRAISRPLRAQGQAPREVGPPANARSVPPPRFADRVSNPRASGASTASPGSMPRD